MTNVHWIIIASAALSSFFALTGHALRVFSRAQLEKELTDENGDGQHAAALLRRFDRNLPALQLTASLGRSLCNILLLIGMLQLMHARLDDLSSVLQAAGLAAAIIATVGIALPMAWASRAAEKVIASTLPLLLGIRYALYPVLAILLAMDAAVGRLTERPDAPHITEEAAKQEILQAASEGQAEGAVDSDEVEMIASVMEFGEIDSGKIMTPRTDVFAMPVDMSWAQACERVSQAGHSRVPIYQGDLDNVIGVLYAKDLLQFAGKDKPATLHTLIRKPYFVPETKPLKALLHEFKVRRTHLAVVLDEYGGTAGVVSIEDILEEIVGEIADEYDSTVPTLMNRIDDETAEADGRLHIDDLNEAMGLDIPEDQGYDTIAGFLFSELGYIPPVGETLDARGARFTVLAADSRKIIRVRIQRLEKSSAREQRELE